MLHVQRINWNLCTVVTTWDKDHWLLLRGGQITHEYFNRTTPFGTSIAGWFIQGDLITQVCDYGWIRQAYCDNYLV